MSKKSQSDEVNNAPDEGLFASYVHGLERTVTSKNHVKYNDNGEPVVYFRRWFVLMAAALGYFTWNQVGFKHVALVVEYAEFFKTTNSFEPGEGQLGIDFFAILDAIVVLVSYPLAGKLIDNYGLKMIILGMILQCIGAWWFFLSGDNYTSALLSRVVTSFGGPLVASSLLYVSMQWFPPKERPFAVGLAVLLSEAGAGVALLQADFFLKQPDQFVDLDLLSCDSDFSNAVNKSELSECTEEAEDNFCCTYDADIEGLNLTMAIWTTIVMIFTLFAVKEQPKTAPSVAALNKEGPSFFKGLKLMFSNRNYSQICLADFIMSGPPQVLFLTLSRIVPRSVDGAEIYAVAGALIIALPLSLVYSYFLNKFRNFFTLTAIAYTVGAVLWLFGTICIAADTDFFDIIFVLVVALAFIVFVLWTVSVYELKLEYVFVKEWHLEGFIVGVDRAIINLSLIAFVAAIPPERADNLKMDGGLFTFTVGLGFMFLGTLLVWLTPFKTRYKRTAFELENVGKESMMDLQEDRTKDFDHLRDDVKEADIEDKQKPEVEDPSTPLTLEPSQSTS